MPVTIFGTDDAESRAVKAESFGVDEAEPPVGKAESFSLDEANEWNHPPTDHEIIGRNLASAMSRYRDMRSRIEGSRGPVKAAVRGFLEGAAERIPFVGSIQGAVDLAQIHKAGSRVAAGKPEAGDIATLARYFVDNEDRAAEWDKKSGLGKAWHMASWLPTHGVEFAATGGVANGLRQLIRRSVIGAAEGAAKKTLARSAVSGVATAGLRTILNAPALAKRTLEFAGPETDDQGRIQVGGIPGSLGKAAVDNFVENATEQLGGVALGKLAKSGLAKVVGKEAAEKTAAAVAKYSGVERLNALRTRVAGHLANKYGLSVPDAAKKIAGKIAFNGALGEYLEERYGEAMRLAAGAVGLELTDPEQTILGDITAGRLGEAIEESIIEGAAFSIPGAAASIANATTNHRKPPAELPKLTTEMPKAAASPNEAGGGRSARSPGNASEIIVSAATKNPKTGEVFTGIHHGESRAKAGMLPQDDADLRSAVNDGDDGFVTNTGRFVSREEAALIADRAKQIKFNGSAGVHPVAAEDFEAEGVRLTSDGSTPASEPERRKPVEMPSTPEAVAEWADANYDVAKPLIDAAKAGKPITQKMMDAAGFYHGKVPQREAFGRALAAIDTTAPRPSKPDAVGPAMTKRTDLQPGDMVTYGPEGKHAIVRDASNELFVVLESEEGQVTVDRRMVKSHRPMPKAAEQPAGPVTHPKGLIARAIQSIKNRLDPPVPDDIRRQLKELGIPDDWINAVGAKDAPEFLRLLLAERAAAANTEGAQDAEATPGTPVDATQQPTPEPTPQEAIPDAPAQEAPVSPPQPQPTPSPVEAPPPVAESPPTPEPAPAAEPEQPADPFPWERRRAVSDAAKNQLGEEISFVDPADEHQEAAQFFASRGITVRFYKAKPGVNRQSVGFTMEDNGEVYLNVATKGDSLWYAVGHEWAHASGADKRLADLPEDLLADMRKEYVKGANPKYKKWLDANPDYWNREAAAKYVGTLMSDAKFRAKLETENPSLWRKIWDGIRQIVGAYQPIDPNARRVLEELTQKQAEADAKAANRRPLPPELAGLDDEGLTQFLVTMGAMKKKAFSAKQKMSREQLEDAVNEVLFPAKRPKTIRFEKPDDNAGSVSPTPDASPDAAGQVNPAPEPSEPPPASNAIVEPRAESDAPPSVPQAPQAADPTMTGRIDGDAVTIDVKGGSPVPAKYAVVELASLTPSHSWWDGWPKTNIGAGYPEGLQPRDYAANSPEADKVRVIASERKPAYFVNNHPAADSGPPTVTNGGVVINGNGRTMGLQLAAGKGDYGWYRDELNKDASKFGIDPKSFAEMQAPVLVRVVDMDASSPEARAFAAAGNQTTTQAQSPIRTAASYATMIGVEQLKKIPAEGDSTFGDMVSGNNPEAVAFRASLFSQLPPQVRPNYFLNNPTHDLNEAGKEFVKAMLLTRVIPLPVAERMGEDMKGWKRAIESAMLPLLQLKYAIPGGDLTPQIAEAIQFQIENPHVKDEADLAMHLDQKSLFEGGKKELSSGGQVMLKWLWKDAKTPAKFANMLREAYDEAYGSAIGSPLLATGSDKSFNQILSEAIGVPIPEGVKFGQSTTRHSLKQIGRQPIRAAELQGKLRDQFPGAKVSPHPLESGTLRVTLPNGLPIDVRQTDWIEINWPAVERETGKKYSRAERNRYQAAGAFTLTLPSGVQTNPLGLIELNRDLANDQTLTHEAWHVASETGMLSPQERAALVDKYSSPDKSRAEQDEDIAEAREAWVGEKGLAKRIINWVRRLLQKLGWAKLKADDVFELMQRPDFWARQPQRMLEGTAYQARVYHGSPHSFDRFSTSEIGTGEGAQSYGWGLYFAGDKKVAEHYRKKLSKPSRTLPNRMLDAAAGDDDIDSMEAIYHDANKFSDAEMRLFYALESDSWLGFDRPTEAVRAALGGKLSNFDPSQETKDAVAEVLAEEHGRMYEVDLKPSEDEYLLWDKPLNEQSEVVRTALRRIAPGDMPSVSRNRIMAATQAVDDEQIAGANKRIAEITKEMYRIGDLPEGEFIRSEYDALDDQRRRLLDQADELDAYVAPTENGPILKRKQPITGQFAYRTMSSDRRAHGGDKWASSYLKSLGIRGIKYLDGSSRSKGDGSYNYVIFDDADVEIVKRYQLRKNTPEYVASLANPGDAQAERDAIDEIRLARPDKETRPDEDVTIAASERLAKDYDGEAANIIAAGESGGQLSDVERIMARRILNEKWRSLTASDPAGIKDFTLFLQAYDNTASEWGYAGRQLRDLQETPEQRLGRILGESVTKPSPRLQERMDNERSEARKERRRPNLGPMLEEHAQEVLNTLKELEQQHGILPEHFAKIATDTKAAIDTVHRVQAIRATMSDKVFEYWINAILSGIPTHVRNITGTLANGAWYFTGQKLAEVALNKALRKPTGAQIGELSHAVGGMIRSLGKASENFMLAWRHEIDAFENSVSATTGRLPTIRQVAIKGRKGRIIRTATRGLQAVDSFLQTIAAHGVAAERAFRVAKSENLSGMALTNRIDQLLANPESIAWNEAVEKAAELAFKQHGGKLNQAVKRSLEQIRNFPGGRYLIPFKNIMVNIFGTGLNMTPLGIFSTVSKARAGKTKHITEDVARNVMSLGFMLMLLSQDEDEPWITGSQGYGGTGKHRYSVNLGGSWWYYGWLEPFATAAGFMVDAARAMKSPDPSDIPAFTLKAVAEQIKNKTFAGQLGDLIGAINSPDKSGSVLSEAAAGFVVSWIPNLIRSTAREWDDEVQNRRIRGKDKAEYGARVIKRILQNAELGLQDMIEGLEDLPRYDIWGEGLPRSQGPLPGTDFLWRLLSPVARTKDQPFVGNRFLAAWKNRHPDDIDDLLYPARPEYFVKGEAKSMTDAQEAQFHRLSGQIAKRLVELGNYDPSNPTAEQWESFKDDFSKARSIAKEMLVAEWTGGKNAADAKLTAEIMAREKRQKAAAELLRLADPRQARLRTGESLVKYRERRESDAAKRLVNLEMFNRMKGPPRE